MLVQTDASREGEIGTDAYKHPAPIRIVDVKVVVFHPPLLQFQMPAIVLLAANRGEDASRFAGLENADNLIGSSLFEIGIHQLVPAHAGIIDNGRSPF